MNPQDPGPHDRIEELIAGYALRSLSRDDAREADRLLSEHVPSCTSCRETLLAFSDVVADLAFTADPVQPPDTLLPRLHRQLEPRGRSPVPRWAGVAAGLAVVVISGGLAVSQALRAGALTDQRDRLTRALAAAAQPDANAVSLSATGAGGPQPVTGITSPKDRWLYLVGEDIPSPPPDYVYRVWLVEGAVTVFAGEFLPDPGVTVRAIPVDPATIDSIEITVEPAGSEATSPGQTVWRSAA